jgi:hypothetical protein
MVTQAGKDELSEALALLGNELLEVDEATAAVVLAQLSDAAVLTLLARHPGRGVALAAAAHPAPEVRAQALDFLEHEDLRPIATDPSLQVRWSLLDRLEDEARASLMVPTSLVLALLESSEEKLLCALASGPLVADPRVALALTKCDTWVQRDLARSEHLVPTEAMPAAFLVHYGGPGFVEERASRLDGPGREAFEALLPGWSGSLADLLAASQDL